jgi:hypothetical protein
MLRVVCGAVLFRIGREYTRMSAESTMAAGCDIANV